MIDWLACRARRRPEATALIDADRGDTWTYRDLSDWVDRRTGRLLDAGVDQTDRVGILCHRSPAVVVTFWAVFRAGAVAVPLDVSENPDVLEFAMETTNLDHLVLESATEPTGVEAAPATTSIHSLEDAESAAVTSLSAFTAKSVTPTDRDLDRTLLILFTSGTTGRPKGVRLTPRNLGASAAGSAFRLGVDPDDRWLLTIPTYHMGGLSIPIRTAMYGTATVVEREFDAESTAETMEAFDVTGVSLVPTMLRRLLETDWDPSGLRFALVGGAPTSAELATEALEAGVPIYPTYGMTETASQVATATPSDVEETPATVGRPIETATVSISPVENPPIDRPDAGSIVVSGPIVSPGYLGEGAGARSDADGSWKRARGDGFRTGDLGYLDDDGRLFVIGRETEEIITGGETVVPSEVEQAASDHPAIRSVCVVGLPDPEWGERVGALVVAEGRLEENEIRSFLENRLADYKIPKTIAFADALPRTASGTVDREAVRQRIREAGN